MKLAGKTVIVIAHRLATVADLDRILVFSQGAIVEDGTHADLLARDGAYRALWSRQSGGLLPQDDVAPAGRPARSSSAVSLRAVLDNPTLGETT